VRILGPTFQGFAENDLLHEDRIGKTPEWLGEGLRRSMLNYLEGRGLNLDVRRWFDHSVPRPRVPQAWVKRLLRNRMLKDDARVERRIVWLGGTPICTAVEKGTRVTLPGRESDTTLTLSKAEARWLTDLIRQATPQSKRAHPYPLLREVQSTFPGNAKEFASHLNSLSWKKVRAAGLVLV
jgi:hypothetical protein